MFRHSAHFGCSFVSSIFLNTAPLRTRNLAILFAVLLLLVALATVVMNIYGVFFAKKIHEKIFYRKPKLLDVLLSWWDL